MDMLSLGLLRTGQFFRRCRRSRRCATVFGYVPEYVFFTNELHKEEIVYYPNSKDPSLQSIRIADGQHMIESQFDRVFDQYTS